MKDKFLTALNSLYGIANQYNEESTQAKATLLAALSIMQLPVAKYISKYHDHLLFLCAYPDNEKISRLAEKELKRITVHAKKNRHGKNSLPENEGLPYANILTRFSPDFLQWLLEHSDLEVEFDSFYDPVLPLNDILNITLPSLLKPETTAGLTNEELLEQLGIKPAHYIPFLVGQLDALKDMPLQRELFCERLSAYVKLVPKNEKFSRAYNRLDIKQLFYQQNLSKQFDVLQLINTTVPAYRVPAAKERQALCKVIRNSMALMVREIDPATFMQQDSIRLYDVDSGLVLAIYSMLPNHQLPLETYFGFTFFKNGIPVSYGGIWAFGKLARLGLNIFEPFRMGESGFILCQLIRVLKQEFGITYFELEPYQFGLDNPGGIKSGAFWFYYKFGFRPVDGELKKLATDEHLKIKSGKNYRSTEKTLIRFTQSNVALNLLPEPAPLDVLDINRKVLAVIKEDWQHNYRVAREKAVEIFCKKTNTNYNSLSRIEKNTAEELSLWVTAMNIRNLRQLKLMKEMVFVKTKDDYAYQQLLLNFFQL
ncbi:MAG: hypothetical protein ABIN36_12875 [Ferruginibacter sp.]